MTVAALNVNPPMPQGNVKSMTQSSTASDMIRVSNLTRRYGDFVALDSVDLAVKEGEFVTLLGPSGSGKSTLLNLISGMTQVSEGQIEIDGRDATHVPTNARGLGMVFQNYALMPHMTVFDNIAFPLQVRKVAKSEIETRVREVLSLIQLEHVADRKPKQLSGGQQQRISLARCIVYRPPIILMDEPLGALDKKLREDMQLEIKRLHAELGVTIIYVTHDQEEALAMSDRIVLMRNGRIEQQGNPEDLYFKPETLFAADFLGSSNLFFGKIDAASGTLVTGAGKLPYENAAPGAADTGEAVLMVRPESLSMEAKQNWPGIEAEVLDTVVLGGFQRHYLRADDGTQLTVQVPTSPNAQRPERRSRVTVSWDSSDARLLPPDPAFKSE
ncbi:Spermidine/putrescine import ATP-binding protein PotA [Roseovarius indicus]|uniref:Spermidine/putrescine import ATP-binding protein PotA n=3 Tax=Roseovarius indicus TaxID=540747 RepID=A0A5P3A8I1_9RHOB|nr:Spermidine/putrescine import ATP-binding protein PotA [Roseovarius indicus]SFE00763.1 putative spermidine/putrescine transport system ATP-binding protein [Roseovarius indicus]